MLNKIFETLLNGQGGDTANKSILEDLYYGRIAPFSRQVQYSPERKAAEDKIETEENYFNETMTVSDYGRFTSLKTLYSQISQDDETEAFAHGFTVGALIMLEVIGRKDEVVNQAK